MTLLVVDGVLLTVAVIFGERTFIEYVIIVPLRKNYEKIQEVFINFDADRKNVLAVILASFIFLSL